MYRYILGLGIGFLPGRFFIALVQQDVNWKVSPKFYVLEYYAEESHFWWSEKVKKSSMMKIEKSSRNHTILKTDFCKCKWRSSIVRNLIWLLFNSKQQYIQ